MKRINKSKRLFFIIFFITCYIMTLFLLEALIMNYARDLKDRIIEEGNFSRTEFFKRADFNGSETSRIRFNIIPLIGFSGLILGAFVYYLLDERKQSIFDMAKASSETLLNLLRDDERRVVEKLIQEKGKADQTEITYLEGFTKVKSHRVLERLKERKVVTKESVGKKNIIRLNKDIYEFLKKE